MTTYPDTCTAPTESRTAMRTMNKREPVTLICWLLAARVALWVGRMDDSLRQRKREKERK